VKKVIGFLRLMRPANIVTAVADVLAGVAIASATIPFREPDFNKLALICLATSFLYGGGVVMNDVFDADLDKIERPERPIPGGVIRKSSAALFGILLLVSGVVCALLINLSTALIATIIAIAALVYDKWAKHHSFLGPLTMGFCRGCNLLLGMIVIGWFNEFLFFAIVPTIYIFAITMISRGEVHGGRKTTLYIAAFLYIIVLAAITFTAVNSDTIFQTAPFLILFAIMIFPPLAKAIKNPIGPNIGKAVKSGVISLIIMNASWAAAVDNLMLALIIIVLLPISLLLARLFAVT
jgi:4-hydroxybenzoate polyprenyltransferase